MYAPKNLTEIGPSAELYLIAHNQIISVANNARQSNGVQKRMKNIEDLHCFNCNQVCHKASECSSYGFSSKSMPEYHNRHKPGHFTRNCKVQRTTSQEIKYVVTAVSTQVAKVTRTVDIDAGNQAQKMTSL